MYSAHKDIAIYKRITITLDEAVYDGLYRTVGKRRMGQFIEDLVRPHASVSALDPTYLAIAADDDREGDASERINALAGDSADETR